MITESVALLILVLILSYFTMRTGRKASALAILPLGVMPAVQVLGYIVVNQFGIQTALSGQMWYLLFLFIGLLCAGALLSYISSNIRSKKARRGYFLILGGFILTFALLCAFSILRLS